MPQEREDYMRAALALAREAAEAYRLDRVLPQVMDLYLSVGNG